MPPASPPVLDRSRAGLVPCWPGPVLAGPVLAGPVLAWSRAGPVPCWSELRFGLVPAAGADSPVPPPRLPVRSLAHGFRSTLRSLTDLGLSLPARPSASCLAPGRPVSGVRRGGNPSVRCPPGPPGRPRVRRPRPAVRSGRDPPGIRLCFLIFQNSWIFLIPRIGPKGGESMWESIEPYQAVSRAVR
jgi:hypothetical protein